MNDSQGIVVDSISLFTGLKNDLLQFLPSFISGVSILILGLIFAFFAKWLSKKIVNWLFLFLPAKMKSATDLQANLTSFSIGTGRVLFFLIILLSVTSSLKTMGFTVLSDWLQDMAKFAPNIIGAIFILFLGWNLKNILSDLIAKALNRVGILHSTIISEFSAWSVFFLCVLVAMEQVGIDLSLVVLVVGIIVSIPFGAISLAFALGIKGSFEDILACYHLKKIVSLNDTVIFNGSEMKIMSIGPIFVTLGDSNQSVSISGKEFVNNDPIVKRLSP